MSESASVARPHTYIVAYNFPEFLDICRDFGLHPYGGDAIYVSGDHALRGRYFTRGDRIIRSDRWTQRRDAYAIAGRLALLLREAGFQPEEVRWDG